MEYMSEDNSAGTSSSNILCCQCGAKIEPNPANMCVACLRSQVDITEGIPKQGTVYFCKACERYLQPPAAWISASLESRELLSLCLKKIKGLNKEVRLVDAGFVWTEPHSKRIKVKLTIQKEVMNGAVLQQVFVVEFTVHSQMCDDCHRVEAKDYWRACAQIRQKTHHKKTLLYLEQLILKHGAHANTTSIKQVHEGLDFFYGHKQEARKMVDFLQTVVPCRYQVAQELISHDIHNNTYQYKTSFSIELVPVCKDDVVCLPAKLAQSLGNLGQVCVVQRVTQTVHLIDPNTCQIAEVNGTTFWRSPFSSICQPKDLIEFTVMESELIVDKEKRHVAGSGAVSQKHRLGDVWVVKSSELGMNEQQYYSRSHLGHLLNPGDTVLGFDLQSANINDVNLEKIKSEKLPDVVLVKKQYAADSTKRSRRRKWHLKHLELGADVDANRDYTEFLEDLEEDPMYRQNVNIYKDTNKLAVDTDDTDEDEAPRVSLAEMLDDLHISQDVEMQDNAEGGQM